MMQAWSRYVSGLAEASSAAADRARGTETPGPVQPGRRDRRFRDPAWEENPAFFGMLQAYLLSGRLVGDVLDASEVDEVTEQRMGFLADVVMDAMAPTNNLWTNPAALKRALDTGGSSVMRGFQTFMDDVANNKGMPRQITPGAFTVGKDLAITPGKIVYRNDLMELIQYTPRTETVYATPLLMSPPWINKYYIMDLAPGRSFVEWAVDHGHTVFAISYHNPDTSDRDVRLDDYLLNGPIAALDVIREITGAEQANIVGLCLGGTLTAALRAYLASAGEHRIASTTLLNTLVDFSRPGRLGAFTDRASVERLERRMAERGFLEASEMMGIFTFMRSNDLVWNYAINNWLMGEDPHPFDILSWNADSTRMPANMHSFYLRSCYLGNELARRRDGARRDPARPGDHPRRPLRPRRHRGPHRALGGQLHDDPGAPERRRPLRAERGGPHRRHRQPAEPEGVVPDVPGGPPARGRGGRAPARPQGVVRGLGPARGVVVGGLGRVDRGPLRRAGQAAPHGEPQAPARGGRPGNVRARDVSLACRSTQCVL